MESEESQWSEQQSDLSSSEVRREEGHILNIWSVYDPVPAFQVSRC